MPRWPLGPVRRLSRFERGASPPEVWASWRPLGVIEHVGRLPELLAER